MPTLTEKQLNAAIRRRAQAAHKKNLTQRICSTIHHFFDGHHGRTDVDGLETVVHTPWEQTSCTTRWDWEIAIYINPTSNTMMHLRYDSASWGNDSCSVIFVDEQRRTTIVFKAQRDVGSHAGVNDPSFIDTWRYDCYVPGGWEKLLDGERLEKIADQRFERRQKTYAKALKDARQQKATMPLSPRQLQVAKENYGIG